MVGIRQRQIQNKTSMVNIVSLRLSLSLPNFVFVIFVIAQETLSFLSLSLSFLLDYIDLLNTHQTASDSAATEHFIDLLNIQTPSDSTAPEATDSKHIANPTAIQVLSSPPIPLLLLSLCLPNFVFVIFVIAQETFSFLYLSFSFLLDYIDLLNTHQTASDSAATDATDSVATADIRP
jgi:uncharacterized membrane protein